jgi:YbbR domain-containing protein
VVIDAELNREDYGSIPATEIGRELKALDVRIDPNQIKLMVKTDKKLKLSN